MTSFTANILQPVLSVVAMISFWKIFEDRGEKGWKAIIPILSTLTLGKVAHDSKHAKGRVFSGIALFISVFILIVTYLFGVSSNYDFVITDMNDINGVVVTEQFTDNFTYNGNPFVLVLLAALIIISAIFYLINHIKLSMNFDQLNNGPSWMIILWIFLPIGAAIYYAFIHNSYDIPGVTNKVEQQNQPEDI